jgi:hypothetical protein
VMPSEVRTAADPIEPALWVGQRIRRFKPIVGHPWFPAIFGRMAAGMSTWRIAQWLWTELPEADPLRSVGFDPLYRRLRRFQKAMPEGVLAARSYLDTRFAAVGAGIDVLEEFDTLIRYQKERIAAKAQVEDAFPVPLEQMRREVEQLADLLELRRDTAVMLGLHPNAMLVPAIDARTVNVAITNSPQEDWIDRLLRARPDLISRMMNAIDEFDALEALAAEVDAEPIMAEVAAGAG